VIHLLDTSGLVRLLSDAESLFSARTAVLRIAVK